MKDIEQENLSKYIF